MKHNFQHLRLDSVARSFTNAEGHSVAALNGLDLTIERGEFIALLGPSGCGKSTALNCIAGLTPLTGGAIWLDDERIDVLPSEKRGFGMVFQNYALFPHMSVLDNVGFGLRMRGVPRAEIEARSREALQLVQLVGHERKLPGQLSGGQQQRVAIARAIAKQPQLLLCDEPTGALDYATGKLVLEVIARINAELGTTAVVITHNAAIGGMADRVVRLADGRIASIERPARRLTPAELSW